MGEGHWEYRLNQDSTYEDSYNSFKTELWADNTLIEEIEIMRVHLKYYFVDKKIGNFNDIYLPMWQILHGAILNKYREENVTLTESNINRFIKSYLPFKISNMLYQCEQSLNVVGNNYTNVLKCLNYDFLIDLSYINKNRDFVCKKVKQKYGLL